MRASSALRWASTREYSRRTSARERPDRGDELVEVRAAVGGRPLDELEPVGLKDAYEWPDGHVEQALDGRTVGRHALLRALAVGACAVADRELVRFCAVEQMNGHARGRSAEAHQLALVARARRARGAAEVEGLEEVRLAGAVGAVNDGQAGAETRLGARVRAEIAHLDADDAHPLTR